MSEERGLGPLIAGLLLVAIGAFLFLYNFYGWDVSAFWVMRLALPAFLLWVGLLKLGRHFLWPPRKVAEQPAKASLLSGLFFTFVGGLLAAEFLEVANFVPIFSYFWPLLIVAFGLGKIIDFYRLGAGMQFRGGEIVGLIALVFLGLFMQTVDQAHFTMMPPWWDVGWDIERTLHRSELQESLSAEGISSVQVVNLYGHVRIEGGQRDQVEVRLEKVITDANGRRPENVARDVRLEMNTDEGVLLVGTNRGQLDRDLRFNTNLVVSLPARLPVKAVNGYGYLRASRLEAGADLENNRGEVIAEFISGDVKIQTRLESVLARNIQGNLTVGNQRGDVRAENVTGLLDLSTEHREIRAENIRGNVIARNYHGTVRLNDIEGEVEIDAVGSALSLSEISRDVTANSSYKDVDARRLEGGFRLKTSNCDVRVAEIEGPVVVEAERSDIVANDLNAGFTVRAKSTRVRAEGINGAASIHTSLRPVQVRGFSGPLEVQNADDSIFLSTGQTLRGTVAAENTNAGITLELPADAAFRLAAQARGSTVYSEFGAGAPQRSEEVLELVNRAGGPRVRLQTQYGPINVKRIG